MRTLQLARMRPKRCGNDVELNAQGGGLDG